MTYYLVVDTLGTVIEETTSRTAADRAVRQYRKASQRHYQVIESHDYVSLRKFR